MDHVENIIVAVLLVDLNRFRSNAQKRLTKDCSDQMCTSGWLWGSKGRVEWLVMGKRFCEGEDVAPNATPGILLPASTAGLDCDEDEGLI